MHHSASFNGDCLQTFGLKQKYADGDGDGDDIITIYLALALTRVL